ncbi:redox-sensitive transcriptional activator SoxR [Allostreptomyces psammosilenae]|uniref:MerR family redox-sensitive transcriptional activator SoxR n=1 Tax=Allostreptomyces psammosilenae TaxID=1892865 RepID=A0A852ZLB7_9ACTN|nr:redox-sensitive transcriptional activator SoxR [Allostreptomyces psammosilenae]NYI03176.1 MerR family redox-sensitive transcriptional activator SoxR [Allostreptomyces psammosilenae]
MPQPPIPAQTARASHLGDLLSIGEVAHRSGVARSALRYYEEQGLIRAERTSGGTRRYRRSVLRRLAFVKAAQRIGLSLEEVRDELAALPPDRSPTGEDWDRVVAAWQARIDERIDGLRRMREALAGCVGCGCLSLTKCGVYNPGDVAAEEGAGARMLREL